MMQINTKTNQMIAFSKKYVLVATWNQVERIKNHLE